MDIADVGCIIAPAPLCGRRAICNVKQWMHHPLSLSAIEELELTHQIQVKSSMVDGTRGAWMLEE